MPAVLILDAQQRSALAATRSLGRRGLRIIAADSSSPTLAGRSRYCAATGMYADPTSHPAEFCDQVRGMARTHEVRLVLPMTDVSTMLLAGLGQIAENTILGCPPAAAYDALTDKQSLVELAKRLNVPAPTTIPCRDETAIRAAIRELGGFPVVLKPQRSKYLADGCIRSTEVRIVRSDAELSRALAEATWLEHMNCLVQEFIPGTGAGVFVVCGADGPISWFSHQRVREKPPWGGVSVVSRSVPVPERLQQYSQAIMDHVGWRGVAMVEYRVTPQGVPSLMEVNGRFWGSLQLAITSGVDFPWLLYNSLCGVKAPVAAPYRVGTRMRWFMGDMDSLIIRLRASRERVPAHEKSRAVWEFVRDTLDPTISSEVFRLTDPAPMLYESRLWLSRVFSGT